MLPVNENEMTKLIPLSFQILFVQLMRFCFKRNTFDDLQAVPMETYDFLRIVGHEPDFPHSQVTQNLRADSIVPEIGTKAKFLVGFDGIEPLILELVRLEFVR